MLPRSTQYNQQDRLGRRVAEVVAWCGAYDLSRNGLSRSCLAALQGQQRCDEEVATLYSGLQEKMGHGQWLAKMEAHLECFRCVERVVDARARALRSRRPACWMDGRLLLSSAHVSLDWGWSSSEFPELFAERDVIRPDLWLGFHLDAHVLSEAVEMSGVGGKTGHLHLRRAMPRLPGTDQQRTQHAGPGRHHGLLWRSQRHSEPREPLAAHRSPSRTVGIYWIHRIGRK